MGPANNNQALFERIKNVLGKQSAGVILLPHNPGLDAVASATSLYLALIKAGLPISLVCATTVKTDLYASDKIQSNLSVNGDSLVISFPYVEGAIDKVDYNIQKDRFNLVITPRQGFPKLDPTQVNYSYTGGNFGFIITIDCASLNNLGEIYLNNQAQFQGKEIINIDRHLTNTLFGTINLVNKSISSLSEMMFALIQYLKIPIDKEIATNLYAGIASSTNNFTAYSVTASTFETIAALLRLGAVKKNIKKPYSPNQPLPPVIPKYNLETQPAKPIESVEKETLPEEPATPQDWLKPKIFRGGGLV